MLNADSCPGEIRVVYIDNAVCLSDKSSFGLINRLGEENKVDCADKLKDYSTLVGCATEVVTQSGHNIFWNSVGH